VSATIEVVDEREAVLATGRFGTESAGYAAMRKHVAMWPERTWAVEGSNGAGRPLAQRLLADGERVVDVRQAQRPRPAVRHRPQPQDRRPRRPRGGGGRGPHLGTRVLAYDDQFEALRMLVHRRAELTRTRIQTVNRLQRLLSELTPGKAKRDITTLQGKAILASSEKRCFQQRIASARVLPASSLRR
jgi:hypothetical protein